MKQRIISFLVCMLVGLFSCKKEDTTVKEDNKDIYYVFTTSSLNLRSAPDKSSESLGTLKRSTKVKLVEKTDKQDTADGITGSWWKVEAEGKTGYMFSSYLSQFIPPKEECHQLEGYLKEVYGELTKDNSKVKNFQSERNKSCDANDEDMENCQASESFVLDGGIEVSLKSGHEWMEEEIFFPGMRPEEGFLLLRECCKEEDKRITYAQFMDMLEKGKQIPEFQEVFYRSCKVKKRAGGLIIGSSAGL